MSGPVPLTLIRLRNATRMYLQVLQDSVPELIVLNEQSKATGVEDDWLETLLACVKASTLDIETVGTTASIEEALSHLLGEVWLE